jgi:hypothetical protein
LPLRHNAWVSLGRGSCLHGCPGERGAGRTGGPELFGTQALAGRQAVITPKDFVDVLIATAAQ